MMIAKHHPEFLTVTCLNWIPVLETREHKNIIIDSLRFLVKEGRAKICCFVLMDTHFHLIWQIMGDHRPKDVQRDFLRFTAQQVLKNLRNQKSPLLEQLLRKHNGQEIPDLGAQLVGRRNTDDKISPTKAGIHSREPGGGRLI